MTFSSENSPPIGSVGWRFWTRQSFHHEVQALSPSPSLSSPHTGLAATAPGGSSSCSGKVSNYKSKCLTLTSQTCPEGKSQKIIHITKHPPTYCWTSGLSSCPLHGPGKKWQERERRGQLEDHVSERGDNRGGWIRKALPKECVDGDPSVESPQETARWSAWPTAAGRVFSFRLNTAGII